jgi:hypothetical protein
MPAELPKHRATQTSETEFGFKVVNAARKERPTQTEADNCTQTYEDWRELKHVRSQIDKQYRAVQILGFVYDFKGWQPLAVIECQKRMPAEAGVKDMHCGGASAIYCQPETALPSSMSTDEDAGNKQHSRRMVVPLHCLPGCAWMDENLNQEDCEKKLSEALELDREIGRTKEQQARQMEHALGGAWGKMRAAICRDIGREICKHSQGTSDRLQLQRD